MTKYIIVFADWFSGKASFVIGHIMLLDVPFHKRGNNGWDPHYSWDKTVSVVSEGTDENSEDEVP